MFGLFLNIEYFSIKTFCLLSEIIGVKVSGSIDEISCLPLWMKTKTRRELCLNKRNAETKSRNELERRKRFRARPL